MTDSCIIDIVSDQLGDGVTLRFSRSLVCYLECAGNHRAMFDLLGGRPAGSPPWGTGAVGNAEWTGVPLAHVLGEAGYVLIGEDYPAEGPAMGQPITTLVINSALALAWPAELHAGPQLIGGYARSPHGAITAVEWSADSGATWSPAEIEPPPSRYSWTPFTIRWTAEPGEHTLTTRATDAAGNTQPDAIPTTRGATCSTSPSPTPSGSPDRRPGQPTHPDGEPIPNPDRVPANAAGSTSLSQ